MEKFTESNWSPDATIGYWKIDTVIGIKSSEDNVLMTLVEGQTRYSIVLKIMSKTAASITDALDE